MSLSTLKKLDSLNWLFFKEKAMLETKVFGTWFFMIGQKHKCCFSLALIAAEGNPKEKVKALLAMQKAIQTSVLFLWNNLHASNKCKVKKEMEDDDLPGMWEALKIKPTPETLDQLVGLMMKLECNPRDPLRFINECLIHQERLHASQEGVEMKSLAQIMRWCISKFPHGNGWEEFKIRQAATPSGDWVVLTVAVEEWLNITGKTKLGAHEESQPYRPPPNYNKAFAVDGMGEDTVETRKRASTVERLDTFQTPAGRKASVIPAENLVTLLATAGGTRKQVSVKRKEKVVKMERMKRAIGQTRK